MFLKSLTVKGFKSFADATTMEFEPGVTVVVGPNGSGKSNVVDAIAWVLGAQAPSAVRSQKMDDVIFAGTAGRPALGRAEVALTIDNSAGLLPIEFSELTVRRTLFRSGDSEYAINDVPCRLLDVQDLLSDAGVGRQQHVIVSQGQIDAVLNARPEDRRAIIEEAAGVLKFRKRKEKAERRLDATEANLLRVQDLLREVRRQLRPLERQAEAARRHGELSAELHDLRVFVAGRELGALRGKLSALAATRAQATADEADLKGELSRLDSDIVALGADLSARGANDVSDRLARADQLRERARGLVAFIAERTRGLERDRGRLLDAGVIATLEADASKYRRELTEVEDLIDGAGPDLTTLESDEATFYAEREELLAALDPPQDSSAASALAEVRGELRSRRSGVERTAAELARGEQRRDALTAKSTELEELRDRSREECAAAQRAEGPLIGEMEDAEQVAIAAESAVKDATAARHRAAEELSSAAARVEALQLALDAAKARAGAEHLAGHDGVVGTLLELVRIEPGWEEAVEAALGEALAAVVVTDTAAATRALRALRAADTAGAVIALGGSLGGTTPQAATPSTSVRAGEPVRPHVAAERDDVERLLDVLLAGSRLVGDLDEAIAVASADPTVVVVTGAGDRFSGSGWRIGAAAAGGVTAAALEDAARRRDDAERERDVAETQVGEATAIIDRSRVAVAEIAKRLDENDARFAAATEALGKAHGELRQAGVELQPLEARIGELAESLAAERERIAELEALIPDLEASESAEMDAAKNRQAVRVSVDARAEVLAGRRRDLEVRLAGLHERADFLRRRLSDTEQRLTADTGERAAAEQRRVVLDRSLAALGQLGRFVESRVRSIEHVHADLADQRRRQSDEVTALSTRLESRRSSRAEAERRLEAVREQARRAEIDEAEARLRLESAVELLRHDLDVEPEVAEAAEQPPLPEGVTAPARVRELDRELRLLGPINPLALEEFTELKERHTFLEEQLDDVRTTRRELNRVIKAVDEEIQTVFAAAYADVSANFTELFGLLFPGGMGRLTLTQPDDLLNTGIEVEAKPGGKNIKKLSLLSGGERSLTALAYLFSVFRSRPSPFYVMDEVEAALDDVNLHRFLSLVAEFREDAQLIIVSHQKRTMEAGDCLFGVTMQPAGSSKVVAEKVAVA